MINRGRRLRQVKNIRELIAEVHINPDTLIYPLFVKFGSAIKQEIKSMPNQYIYSLDMLNFEIESLLKMGIKNIILFGIPEKKDLTGTHAYHKNGIIQCAIREIKSRFKEMVCITDVCMCEYTSHGHCGILDGDNVDNDKTIKELAKIALSHVEAGADMVAPSDMMDGRIRLIRDELDKNGYINIPIMSYSVKYASSFYGPFRDAVECSPSFGDRNTYQMDYRNRNEAIKEAHYDIQEGTDIIMVKPALSYLDIIRDIRENVNLPICAYSVSGEYYMIKIAGNNGIIDEKKMIMETATSIYRAGANTLITYFAKDIVNILKNT